MPRNVSESLPSGKKPRVRSSAASFTSRTGHADARLVASFDDAERAVVAGARAGDVVITMGAGDVTLLSDRLLEALGR